MVGMCLDGISMRSREAPRLGRGSDGLNPDEAQEPRGPRDSRIATRERTADVVADPYLPASRRRIHNIAKTYYMPIPFLQCTKDEINYTGDVALHLTYVV